MSTVAIVLIVVGVLLLVLFVGGFAAARRRANSPQARAHVEHALRALERARASDRGWDPAVMERTARTALEEQRPGSAWEAIELVLVDDRPGVSDDSAHMVGRGPEGEARVVLSRREGGEWFAERVE